MNRKTIERKIENITKKASAWYQDSKLLNEAGGIPEYEPPIITLEDGTIALAMVEIGTIAEISYFSDKYDGIRRLWTHEVTGTRRLFISTDGSTLVVWPPFKVTKRGLEG